MSKYHMVYVTKLGVPFIEEAQEYPDEKTAAFEAAAVFTPTPDDKGNLHFSPVMVRTHDEKTVVLMGIDHINVLTPDELAAIKQQEQLQMGHG